LSGLYQRALAYIRTQSEPVRPGEPSEEPGRHISEEDREKVLGQINEIVASNRIQVTPETLSFTPKQKGGVLPILINAGAAVVLIGGILTAVLLFRRQEQTIVTTPATLETAEGRLIQALREESERELSQKQQEIDDIQGRLQRINQEKSQLQEQTEARLRERERELREALSLELEAERTRLRSAGVSDERITAQLLELESERSRSLESEMVSFRGQVEEELRQREATLNNLIGEYEQNLRAAQSESARLQEELAARQAELEAQYREQETVLQADRARALEQLDRLREQQEKEQLIRDQFLSFYARTRDHLAGGRFPEALSSLQEFRSYLDQPSVSGLPGIRKRRPVELFLIDSLERLIAREERSAGTDTGSLIASADLIARVSEMIERADRLFQDRDYQRARELYLSALAQIPAVELGYERLQEIEALFARRREEQVAALIRGAGSAYREGDYETAVGGYRRALTVLQGEQATAEQMIARIMDSGFRIRSAEQPRDLDSGAGPEELLAAREQADALLARLEAAELTARQRGEELEAARRRIVQLEAAEAQARARLSELEEAGRRIPELEAARDAAVRRAEELDAAADDARRRAAELQSARDRIARLEADAEATGRRLAELQSAERDRQAAGAELEDIRRQYLALSAQAAASAKGASSSLVTLLETKVLIQRVLISEPVRSQYPELYDRFESYLEALVQEQERSTQVAVLRDVETLLDSLIQSSGRQMPVSALEPYRAGPASQPFLRVLDKLELLLR